VSVVKVLHSFALGILVVWILLLSPSVFALEPDVSRQLGLGVAILGQHIRVPGHEQDIVEGIRFLGRYFIHDTSGFQGRWEQSETATTPSDATGTAACETTPMGRTGPPASMLFFRPRRG
jgi:hypothetical protein